MPVMRWGPAYCGDFPASVITQSLFADRATADGSAKQGWGINDVPGCAGGLTMSSRRGEGGLKGGKLRMSSVDLNSWLDDTEMQAVSKAVPV